MQQRLHVNYAHMPMSTSLVRQLHRDLFQFTVAGGGSRKVTDNQITEKRPDGSVIVRHEALKSSSLGWHEGAHSLLPWWEYFLGVVLHKACQDFEARVGTLATRRGAKRQMIRDTIDRLPPTFRVRDIEQAMPGASRPTVNRAIAELRDQGRIRLLRGGRDARWEKVSEDPPNP